MKKLSIISQILVLFFFACKKDDPMVTVSGNPTPAALTAATAAISKVISAANLNTTLEFDWTAANYGVATQVTYTLQLDSKCGTFANPVVVGTTTTTTFSIGLADLNTKLLGTLGIAPNKLTSLQVRVSSVINTNGALPVVSAAVPIKIAAYSDQPDILWLGENSPTAPILYDTGGNVFEGYRNITTSSTFRFADSPVCADTVYGAGAGGALSLASGAGTITLKPGYYKIDVEEKTLKLDTLTVAWGLIGDATPGGWNTSTAMKYNAATDTWSASVALIPGSIKFRANNAWDVNLGPANSNVLTGTLVETQASVTITSAGIYLVTIDFSQSKSPYQYTYTIVQSGDLQEPAKLWLPGGYEGYVPANAPYVYAVTDSVNVYEGFANIPSSTGFKFTSAPDYSHINYGDSTATVNGYYLNGLLTTNGLAGNITLPATGWYWFHANTDKLTYSTYNVTSWGAIGDATPGGWNTSTPMTYDANSNTWSVTLALVNGSIKFRANNAWDLNLGPASSTDFSGQLIYTTASISIPPTGAGNYTVTIDMSRSASPYQYTYTVVKNN